jgi:hypothetical protein
MDLCTSVSMKINHISCDNNYEYRKVVIVLRNTSSSLFRVTWSDVVQSLNWLVIAYGTIWYINIKFRTSK